MRRPGAREGRGHARGERGAGLAARAIALGILVDVERRSAFADVLLGARLPALAPADRRLATRLVLGTLAWRSPLDFEIEHLARRRIADIEVVALQILRLGLFQLRYLDRIPRHAAVDTSVELAKHNPASRDAAGFINAVLRRAARESVPVAAPDADEMERLAIAASHPRWLVERFVEWFGRDGAERVMAANNDAAPNAIRLNLRRGSRAELIERLRADGFEIGSEGRAPETILLSSAPRFDSESYRAGLFHPQSEASQMVARMLAPRPGATVIDCAAAPGGKTTHLAELVGERGRVIAIDINFTGLKNARALARRLRHRNIDFVRADIATSAPPLKPARFEFVLLDAPCTGIGTLREHPEIKWRLGPNDFTRMAALQARLLANAATLVRPGGVLVYSVCSFAPEEGAMVIGDFLAAHPQFRIDRQPPNFAELAGVIDADGFMRTRPDQGALDGFFSARLVRESD
ncbi:MAG TPA: 16S rRNA (cytosine(967)-C(5))-methyltransferase RsmB [Candidatus Binataceae bacterium]|nr:16S rRNA (cytosine(967)-C(5))-methyltransferase RsmB [Candidatus Binataceae bacterium]